MGLVGYLKEVKGEMKHVSWPSQRQVVIFTVAVIIISLLTAVYLGIFDYFFQEGIRVLLNESLSNPTSNALEVTDITTSTTSPESALDTTSTDTNLETQ